MNTLEYPNVIFYHGTIIWIIVPSSYSVEMCIFFQGLDGRKTRMKLLCLCSQPRDVSQSDLKVGCQWTKLRRTKVYDGLNPRPGPGTYASEKKLSFWWIDLLVSFLLFLRMVQKLLRSVIYILRKRQGSHNNRFPKIHRSGFCFII